MVFVPASLHASMVHPGSISDHHITNGCSSFWNVQCTVRICKTPGTQFLPNIPCWPQSLLPLSHLVLHYGNCTNGLMGLISGFPGALTMAHYGPTVCC